MFRYPAPENSAISYYPACTTCKSIHNVALCLMQTLNCLLLTEYWSAKADQLPNVPPTQYYPDQCLLCTFPKADSFHVICVQSASRR